MIVTVKTQTNIMSRAN